MEDLTVMNIKEGQFPMLQKLTNAGVRRLSSLAEEDGIESSNVLVDWLQNLYSYNGWPWPDSVQSISVLKKISSIKNWKPKKMTKLERDNFLSEEFQLPIRKSPSTVDTSAKHEQSEPSWISKRIKLETPQKIEEESDNTDISSSKSKYLVKHVNNQTKLKNNKIGELRAEVNKLNKELNDATNNVQLKQEELLKLLNQKKAMKSYYNKKFGHRSSLSVQTQTDAYKPDSEVQSLVSHLQWENGVLREEVDSLKSQNSAAISTKSDGKTYSNKLRETVYALSEKQVLVRQISPVIQAVVKGLLNVELSKEELPDMTTTYRIIKEIEGGVEI